MEKTSKFVTILLWVLLAVSAILVISLMVNINDEVDTDPVMLGWVNTNIIWAYILVILSAGIAIISSLIHMINDRKALKGGLIALGFFVVVGVISYSFASDAMPHFMGVQKFIEDGTLTPRVSRLVDTGLYATYILLGLAILSVVYSSVSRLLK